MKENSTKLIFMTVTGVWTGCYGGNCKGRSIIFCYDGNRHGNRLLQKSLTGKYVVVTGIAQE
jgi:hypothetical protein